ncbi:DUF6636 domain-containing protein [Solicola gregarius]|uniref:Uncharacterized protein n=1 Tax=Solicola gregarius TaxID=2908642 RepID=A0AA46TG60_9ACTN|nr:DUF6636 domain-containing protein [Solicola gregarius]UYM04749.1 hypothetical protein L0C25_19765 [Solicola gregarius]
MRQYVAVMVVLACVLSGCASAQDIASDVPDGSGRDDGKPARGDKPGKDKDDKGKHDHKHKNHKKKDKLEVRLHNVVGQVDHFSSPSTNIGCQITDDGVRCDIEKRRYKPPHKPGGCDLDFGNALAVGEGEPDFVCAGDTVLGAPTLLAYGTATRVGDYGCQSRKAGMRCYNLRTGRGFLLSRGLYEFY